MYIAGQYDVVVVGAGHAGCEAAHAAARKGCRVALLTQSLDTIAMMPCNPSVGGPAKGHIVAEIDAMGGLMAKAIDASSLQIRMLNTGKGPAVRALRAQADKRRYQHVMRRMLERTPGVSLFQCMVREVRVEDGRVSGVVTDNKAFFAAGAVVVTTGTYMRGKIIVGDTFVDAGPNSLLADKHLSDSLLRAGLTLGRFKTGTPPRIHGRSIDFSLMQEQPGDEGGLRFSSDSPVSDREQLPCWLTYTTEETHELIRQNLHRSPLYAGAIAGTGPRYCPSIEDKVVRFADKERHQIFLEPEGYDTDEYYVQGFSTSMPEDVQREMIRTIIGLERAELMRPGYAIEYDYVEPTGLTLTLETKVCSGLFTAGQINGSSGYEEAAGQGLLAGANAAARVLGQCPLVVKRSDGYIGVLVDDLVTKGTKEPYRLMTSRAEYRLLLRQDNARDRLTPLAYEHGLVAEPVLLALRAEQGEVSGLIEGLERLSVPASEEVNRILEDAGTSPLTRPVSAASLLRRPEVPWSVLLSMAPQLQEVPRQVAEKAEIHVRYAGYILKQEEEVAKFTRLETRLIPTDLDYSAIRGLSNEAREKLARQRPLSLGQASRISGVSPADISILMVYVESR